MEVGLLLARERRCRGSLPECCRRRRFRTASTSSPLRGQRRRPMPAHCQAAHWPRDSLKDHCPGSSAPASHFPRRARHKWCPGRPSDRSRGPMVCKGIFRRPLARPHGYTVVGCSLPPRMTLVAEVVAGYTAQPPHSAQSSAQVQHRGWRHTAPKTHQSNSCVPAYHSRPVGRCNCTRSTRVRCRSIFRSGSPTAGCTVAVKAVEAVEVVAVARSQPLGHIPHANSSTGHCRLPAIAPAVHCVRSATQ